MIDNPNFTTVTTSSYSKASGGMRASSYCDINGANCKTTSEMGGGADTNAITLCPNDQFLDGDGTCWTATQIVNNGGGGGAMLYKCPAHPGLGSYDFRSICKDPFIFDDSRCAGQVTTSSSCAEYFITSTSYYDSSQSYCDKRTITCSPL